MCIAPGATRRTGAPMPRTAERFNPVLRGEERIEPLRGSEIQSLQDSRFRLELRTFEASGLVLQRMARLGGRQRVKRRNHLVPERRGRVLDSGLRLGAGVENLWPRELIMPTGDLCNQTKPQGEGESFVSLSENPGSLRKPCIAENS